MKDLISKCWAPEYFKRPSFEEIFNALSKDLSYSKEKVDRNEIENYIKKITKIPDPPNLYILNKILVETHEVEKIFFNTNEFKITSQKICEGAFSTTFYAKRNNDDDDNSIDYSASIINTDIFKGYDQMLLTRESLIILQSLNFMVLIFNHFMITRKLGQK